MNKTLFTLSIAFLCVTQLIAQTSNLIVFSDNGERFNLVLNGIQQNVEPQTNVKVIGLNAPNYKAKIIFEDKTLDILNKNVYFEEASEVTYHIKKHKKGGYVLRVMSMVPIAQAPKTVAPQQNVVTYTTVAPAPTTSVTITETTTTTTVNDGGTVNTSTGTATGERVDMGILVSENGMNLNMNINVNDNMGEENMDVNMNTTNTSTTTYTTTTTTSAGIVEPVATTAVVESSGNCASHMSPNDFADAKNSIASKTFEDSKMTMAKQITKTNCLLSEQVKEIMGAFDFEDSKLEFAKFAYPYTYDQNKYYKVNDAFEFETSIQELNEAIGQ